MTKTGLRIGDRVKFRVSFLRGIGAYTGPLPFARGTVARIETLGESFTLVTVDWGNDNVPARVNAANITHVSDLETASY